MKMHLGLESLTSLGVGKYTVEVRQFQFWRCQDISDIVVSSSSL
jgi:hypothetical protein